MQTSVNLFLIVVFTLALSSGCANVNTKSKATLGQLDGLLLAEPEPIDSRTQALIARYSHILGQPSLTDGERAELFYRRGQLYDNAGLGSLARFDFSQAINLKPTFAPAYNSLGVHLIQRSEFDQAFEAFDSTLDIDPSQEFALLNRGIALYYAGRPKLGLEDLEDFLVNAPTDPFRVLWAYSAYLDVDPVQAQQKLIEYRTQLDTSHWAVSLVDFYLGKATEDDVLQAVITGVTTSQELTHRLCEAYFYLGKYHAANNNAGVALTFFKLSLSTNVYEYLEHKYARLEIARLRENFTSQP